MRVFVTGASGWIGSAVVPELLAHGHQVVGLARSQESAAALTAAGAEVVRGSIDDLDVVRTAATDADGVIHLAFKHDLAFAGDFPAAVAADRTIIEAFGDALAGTDKPFLIASGCLGLAPGRVATEDDGHEPADGIAGGRMANAELTLALAERGVRSVVVRLPPTTHGDGDNGFMTTLVGIARSTGVAGYIDDGSARWPAVHRSDAAVLYRLALEKAPAGSTLHAVQDEGVSTKEIAEVWARHLGLPLQSVPAAEAPAHFSWLAGFFGVDSPSSSAHTRALLGWEPVGPTLLDDLEAGHYFKQ